MVAAIDLDMWKEAELELADCALEDWDERFHEIFSDGRDDIELERPIGAPSTDGHDDGERSLETDFAEYEAVDHPPRETSVPTAPPKRIGAIQRCAEIALAALILFLFM